MNQGQNAVLTQIQVGHIRVANRQTLIEEKTTEANELRDSHNKFNELTDEIKDLKSENKSDRQFVQKSIEFYEAATGDAVGTGPLFNGDEDE